MTSHATDSEDKGTFEEKIDEITLTLWGQAVDATTSSDFRTRLGNIKPDEYMRYRENARKQANERILSLVETDIIGEDERQLLDDDDIASMPYKARVHEVSEKEYKEARNDLRAEQRKRLHASDEEKKV